MKLVLVFLFYAIVLLNQMTDNTYLGTAPGVCWSRRSDVAMSRQN